MPVVKVPLKISEEGRRKSQQASDFQDARYGLNFRVCNVCGGDGDHQKFRESITGMEFTKGDLNPSKKKKR